MGKSMSTFLSLPSLSLSLSLSLRCQLAAGRRRHPLRGGLAAAVECDRGRAGRKEESASAVSRVELSSLSLSLSLSLLSLSPGRAPPDGCAERATGKRSGERRGVRVRAWVRACSNSKCGWAEAAGRARASPLPANRANSSASIHICRADTERKRGGRRL